MLTNTSSIPRQLDHQGVQQQPQKPRVPLEAPVVKESEGVSRKTQLSQAEMEQVRLAYDKPDGRNNKALASYQDVAQTQTKQQISQTFGIDVYV